MSIPLILLIAVATFGSRLIAMVAMPQPSDRVRAVLDRIPAPLFAALAAMSLFEDGNLASAPTLCAAIGALAATPTRSLLWVLAGGLAGYGVGDLIF